MGPPKIEFDYEDVKRIALLNPTQEEMAAFFNCSHDVIGDRMKNDPEFANAYREGLGQGKLSIRRAQMRLVQDHNPTMCIWMGKQLLGQSDKNDHNVDLKVDFGAELRNALKNG
mgnify:CR=1 FL=1